MTARTVLEFFCDGARCARLAYANFGQLPNGWCWVGLTGPKGEPGNVKNYCAGCQRALGMVKGKRAGEMLEVRL